MFSLELIWVIIGNFLELNKILQGDNSRAQYLRQGLRQG